MNVTVRYFNHTIGQVETREHELAEVSPDSIQDVVDLFDAQVGTVINIVLYQAAVNEDDLRR